MDRSKIFKVISTRSLSRTQAQAKAERLMTELMSYAGVELVQELEQLLAGHKGTDTSLVELIKYYDRADEDGRKQLASMAKFSLESVIHGR